MWAPCDVIRCEDFVSVLSNTSDGNAGEYVVTMLDMALVNINSTQASRRTHDPFLT